MGKTLNQKARLLCMLSSFFCAIRQLKEDSLATIKQVKKSDSTWLHVPPSSQLFLLLPHGVMSVLREEQATEELMRLYHFLSDIS